MGKKNAFGNRRQILKLIGGVSEDRTHAPVTRPTSLAGKPLHHLGITP